MNIDKHFIENYTFYKKNVIIRVDWNIPYDINFKILDPFRIISSLKSINYIYNQNSNRIIIISHLGRPNSSYNRLFSWVHFIEQIKIITKYSDLIFLENGLSMETLDKLTLNLSKIYLLENIRFHSAETNYEGNDFMLEKNIFNELGDIYVNDAFSCMHRKHLSICGYEVNNQKSFGYLVKKELDYLKLLLNNTDDKLLAIIGGSKIEDKMPLLMNLSKVMDGIFIGGGLINSILKDNKKREFIDGIRGNRAKVFEMEDGLASENSDNEAIYYSSDNLPVNKYFFDIGGISLNNLENIIKEYDIIFWNGPLGLIEKDDYKGGSNCLIDILIKSGKRVLIGGGDTAAIINNGFKDKFEFVSTAGGALIEYISNKTLVGLEYFN
jgi:phosphoglycerate kinase